MRYEKPVIEVIGDAQTAVLGTKCTSNNPDNVSPCFIQSVAAYEADE
jgi:hypothetical protein